MLQEMGGELILERIKRWSQKQTKTKHPVSDVTGDGSKV